MGRVCSRARRVLARSRIQPRTELALSLCANKQILCLVVRRDYTRHLHWSGGLGRAQRSLPLLRASSGWPNCRKWRSGGVAFYGLPSAATARRSLPWSQSQRSGLAVRPGLVLPSGASQPASSAAATRRWSYLLGPVSVCGPAAGSAVATDRSTPPGESLWAARGPCCKRVLGEACRLGHLAVCLRCPVVAGGGGLGALREAPSLWREGCGTWLGP